MTFLCWPDTEHPAYAKDAATIRNIMADRDRRTIAVPQGPRDSRPGTPRLLAIKKAGGGAPYVGKPFVYIWDVAIDDLNRWVAGPSRIEHTPEDLMA